MITFEMEHFGAFSKDDVFRISIINDDLQTLSADDLREYTNLRSLMLENNQNLTTVDLRGNTSLQYICLGTCDHLATINLDGTNIANLDLYDLVALKNIELDYAQLIQLKTLLSENITRQFLCIEDAILECFERKIDALEAGEYKAGLLAAYEDYLDTET